MRAMRADIEGLQLQLQKLEAKMAGVVMKPLTDCREIGVLWASSVATAIVKNPLLSAEVRATDSGYGTETSKSKSRSESKAAFRVVWSDMHFRPRLYKMQL